MRDTELTILFYGSICAYRLTESWFVTLSSFSFFFFDWKSGLRNKAQILWIIATAYQIQCFSESGTRGDVRQLTQPAAVLRINKISGDIRKLSQSPVCVSVYLLHNNPQTPREGVIVMLYFTEACQYWNGKVRYHQRQGGTWACPFPWVPDPPCPALCFLTSIALTTF